MIPPIVVIEGTEDAFARAVAETAAAGWRVHDGFQGPVPGAGPVVRAGAVSSANDAAAALLSVLGGVGVVVHGIASREVIDRLLDDLRHVGPVDHRHDSAEPEPALDDDARAILRHLAEGRTLGAAADAIGLSRRTADRRLAEARRSLGVERTVEAVSKARRLGWLG